MTSCETYQVRKMVKHFFAVIYLKMVIFRSVKRTLPEVSISKLSKQLMSLHCYGKIGNNVPHLSDFLHLKITIRISFLLFISYKYKLVKVPNLVYFGSPNITS